MSNRILAPGFSDDEDLPDMLDPEFRTVDDIATDWFTHLIQKAQPEYTKQTGLTPDLMVIHQNAAAQFNAFWNSTPAARSFVSDNNNTPYLGNECRVVSFICGLDVETSQHIKVPAKTLAVLLNRDDITNKITVQMGLAVDHPHVGSEPKTEIINVLIKITPPTFGRWAPRTISATVRGFAINISDILDGPVDDLAAVRTQPYSFNKDTEPQRREEEPPTFTFGSQLNFDEMGLFSRPAVTPAAPERITTGHDQMIIQQFWRSNTTAAASPWISRVQPL